MKEGIRKYYTNTSNNINYEYLDGGITIVAISSKNEKEVHRLKIKNIYTDNEEILECVTVSKLPSAKRAKRIKEAKLGNV